MVKINSIDKFKTIQPYLENNVTLTFISKNSGIAIRTLHRWVQQYKENGLDGLVFKGRNDKGCYRTLSENLIHMVEGLALQKPKRSIAAIHRQLVVYSKDNNQPPPSYSIISKIINNMSPALMTLAHEGVKQYQQKYDLLYIREADRPNQIWQADHTLLDIYVKNTRGELKRPWLTIIMDDYSRAIAGYYLSFDAPSAQQTGLTLRQAIWKKSESSWLICGIPEILYTDHGSDFTSKHIEEVCASLKIQLIFSTVGKPRGRGKIERFFSTVNQCFLQDLPGYIKEGIIFHENKCLFFEELDSKLKLFILGSYNHSSHSTTNIPPAVLWQANQFLPHMPKNQETLDLLLLTLSKSRQVHRDGIKFQGLRYFSTILADFVGQKVVIRYDPRDMAEIHIFYQDKFLCRAISQDLESCTVSLKEIIAARNKRKKELRDNIKNRRSLVDSILQVPEKIPKVSLLDGANNIKEAKNSNSIKRYQYE